MHEKHFFIYARKSTESDDRQVRSIADQLAELRELARRERLTVKDVFVEQQTAKVPGRPVFNQMLDAIERGEATGILAWHPDRLSRNAVDGGRIIHLVDLGNIKELKFPTFWFEPTPQGKFMLSMAFSQSKYYVDNLSENIRRGQRQKVKNGIWPMVAPVGYLNDKKNRTIVLDPVKAPLVRKTFELYATGEHTLDSLTSMMTDLGLTNRRGQSFYRTRYYRILQNPIYCGIIEYRQERYEGKHEQIISKRLFDQVQQVIKRKSKPHAPHFKPYLYRGIFRCGECGCMITIETQKGHNYLHCTKRVKRDCSQRYVREEEITRQVTGFIERVTLSPDVADWMLAELENDREQGRSNTESAAARLQEKTREVDRKIDRLTTAYLEQALTLQEYRSTKATLVDEKRRIEDELVGLTRMIGGWFEPAIRFVEAAKQGYFLARSGKDEEKCHFLRKTGSNLTISDRHLSVIPRGPWKTIENTGRFAQREAAAL